MKNLLLKYFSLIVLLHFLPGLPLAQTIYHVNKAIQGGQQTGLDWSNAFSDLQAALAAAKTGEEIWVAKGVYYPTATIDRTVSFKLKQGVKLYGGFAGTETTLTQRDFVQHETVLSGNIGNTSTQTDNSINIVTGQGLDSTACLNGFMIKEGYADLGGGAVFLKTSTQYPITCPIIENCRFEHNFALAGAALHCQWNGVGAVSPRLKNCQFRFNRAQYFGGALLKDGPSPTDYPFLVENCTFSDNRAMLAALGGAVFFSTPSGFTSFRKCIFERDTAFTGLGGAIYHPRATSVEIFSLDSCIFRENHADEAAGICHDELSDLSYPLAPFICKMNNCVFEKNTTRTSDGAAFIFNGDIESRMQLFMDNCLVKDNKSRTALTIWFHGASKSDIMLSVRNSQFIGNHTTPNDFTYALGYGVGGGDTKCRAFIENSVFAHNGAGIQGLGHHNDGNIMETNITNCTFYDNGETIVEKSWYPTFNDSTHYNNMYINNSVFWENTTPDRMFSDGSFMVEEYQGYYIDHVLFKQQANEFRPGIIGPHAIYGKNPMFRDSLTDDFQLLPCSPAVNFGNNLVVDMAGIEFDINGYPRIFRDTVDLGAYEAQDSCSIISIIEKSNSPLKTVQVYPNPVSKDDKIELTMLLGLGQSEIFGHWRIQELNGRQLSTGTFSISDNRLNVPEMPGIYFLTLWDKYSRKTLKFVVVP